MTKIILAIICILAGVITGRIDPKLTFQENITATVQPGSIPSEKMKDDAMCFLTETVGMFYEQSAKIVAAEKVRRVPREWDSAGDGLCFYLQVAVSGKDGASDTAWFTIFITKDGKPTDFATDRLKFN